MKFIHFLYVPFTGLGLFQGMRGDTWLKNRIKIFNQFVLPSILNQTSRDFILLVSWRPEEKINPIVLQFKETLDQIRGLATIFTYHGILFWDDKYDDETAYKRLQDSLEQTLPELAETVKDSEFVYLTIQPSDDMYVSHAMDITHTFFGAHDSYGVLGFSRGYMIRYDTKEIAEYNPTTTPPFYTTKFSKEVFLDPRLHMNFRGRYKSHEYVKDCIPSYYMPERGFVVGVHGENISTSWNHLFIGRKLTPEEAEKILMDTGNYFTEPLTITKDNYRKWMKRILNVLPPIVQRKIICLLSTNKVENQIKNYHYFNV